LPEIDALPRLLRLGAPHLEARTLCHVKASAAEEDAGACPTFAVQAITLGNPSPEVPAIGFFGGVHGLERIGAEVVMAYLEHLVQRLRWDRLLHQQLEGLRMVFMPLVNPGGLWLGTRANPQGIDLMRNAPVQALEPVPWLIGGQRISATLPWYRGPEHAPMAAEAQALVQVVQDELLGRPFSLAIDCHSGFGSQDRLWFPYAHTRRPIEHLAEVYSLHQLFAQAHAHHRYVFEPQSLQYLAHGDLWDHLYLQALQRPPITPGAAASEPVFLPLTLEMGSWLWVRKNPRQLFSRHGIFNPLIEHRRQRVLRRHMSLLDFMARAAHSHANWLPAGDRRVAENAAALAHWQIQTCSTQEPR
jgi:hypothetical protein